MGSSLTELDKACVWHPFSSLNSGDNISVERGEGVWLYTENGDKILDGISSWWVNLFGHSHPYIAKAIADQALRLEHVIFAGFTHPQAVRLAERLIHILGKDYARVFFSDNGSTSVEVALKMAVQFWSNQGSPKRRIVALQGAYHGDTFGAMSAGERSLFTRPFSEMLFEVDSLPFPVGEKKVDALIRLENLAKTGEIAAFIYEPLVQATGGMRVYSPDVLQDFLTICRKYDVLTIADEVFTGFGRTGKFFASGYCDNMPDIICMSKGITGGFLPLGATVVNEKTEAAFQGSEKEKIFYHGHSYTANPLACAAANASLDLLLDPETIFRIKRIEALHKAFKASLEHHPKIARIDHLGTIFSIELHSEETAAGYFNTIRDFLYDFFLDRKILLRPLGNVTYILPPYCISDSELEILYSAIKKMLEKV